MTTIVYRDGIIAADTRAYSGSTLHIGKTDKIHVITNSGITAYCGFSTNKVGLKQWLKTYFTLLYTGDEDIIQQYLRNTTTRPQLDFTGLLVKVYNKTKYVQTFYLSNSLYPTKVCSDYLAIGTGAQYALGAMYCGADAVSSVKAASHLDVWSGDGVDSYNVITGQKSQY